MIDAESCATGSLSGPLHCSLFLRSSKILTQVQLNPKPPPARRVIFAGCPAEIPAEPGQEAARQHCTAPHRAVGAGARLSRCGPGRVAIADSFQVQSPVADLIRYGKRLRVQAQDQRDPFREEARPVCRRSGNVRHIADTSKFRDAIGACQEDRTLLEDRTPAAPLRAANQLETLRYDILRIPVRKA